MYRRRLQSGSAILVLLLALVFIIVIIVIGLRVMNQQATQSPIAVSRQNSSATTLRGVSLSPASYDAAGFSAFFSKASALHGIVEWQGDWQELGQAGSGANLVVNNAAQYGYTPVLVVSAFKDAGQSKSVPIRPLTTAQQDTYVAKAATYVQDHHPAYFGVGVEVNRIHETSVSDYQAFVALFNRTVTAVHSVSPATKVFTTFQLERIRGLRGGLYGGANDEQANDWKLLDDFSAADDLGFTSYPALIYKHITDLPVDYYQAISAHTSKPIVFTETGWPASDEAAGWISTASDQAVYVTRILSDTRSLRVPFVVWSFLYDQQVSAPFNHLGLIAGDGSVRPGWQTFSK